MTNQENAFETYQKILGIRITENPDANPMRGFIQISGRPETIIQAVKNMTELGGYPSKLTRMQTAKKIETDLKNSSLNIDLEIPIENRQVLIRVVSYGTRGNTLEVSFGGGGNETPYSDMVVALQKALDSLL